jgi:hypothetical protein
LDTPLPSQTQEARTTWKTWALSGAEEGKEGPDDEESHEIAIHIAESIWPSKWLIT